MAPMMMMLSGLSLWQTLNDMDFEIISTGSSGNCVVLNKIIAVDIGVPFKALKDFYKELQLVLLTHEHKDHIKHSTVKRLAQESPSLRWGCGRWLVPHLVECGVPARQIDIYIPNEYMRYHESLAVVMKPIPHNVPNAAWLIFGEGESFMYATDCSDLSHITANGFDLYLIEANYTEADILERIRQKQEAGEHCYEWDVLQNHLSKEKAENWLYENMGAHSQYVLLHQHQD